MLFNSQRCWWCSGNKTTRVLCWTKLCGDCFCLFQEFNALMNVIIRISDAFAKQCSKLEALHHLMWLVYPTEACFLPTVDCSAVSHWDEASLCLCVCGWWYITSLLHLLTSVPPWFTFIGKVLKRPSFQNDWIDPRGERLFTEWLRPLHF